MIPGKPSAAPAPLPVGLRGLDLLLDPILNKGSAFPRDERRALGLEGLLPPGVMTLDDQLRRVVENYDRKTTDLERYIYLAALHDRNETLFYRFLGERIDALLPIVYTPTVGDACRLWSHIFRRPRGLYISAEETGRVAEVLARVPARHDVRVIVVTDGERILGLGDLGAGGMGIPIGKLAIYTAAAGIDPASCLPVCLDVGTNNQALQDDPLYLGLRRPRLRGEAYDALVDEFAGAALRRWPGVLLQWEDFGNQNAFRLLERWRDRALSFNDDIQGTGAVALAGILAALRSTGGRIADQRVVFVGAGEASSGIADQVVSAMVEGGLTPAEARLRIYMVDRTGLVVRGEEALPEHKARYAREAAEVSGMARGPEGGIGLEAVIRAARPGVLVGASGAPGAFTEAAVRALAEGCARPIVMPLSNPTSKAECTAEQAHAWTGGRAFIATGSPFAPVVRADGSLMRIGQANNAFIFPGVGLGALVSQARRVTDGMFHAAAMSLASLVTEGDLAEGALYPSVLRLREAAGAVAAAVVREAVRSGEARAPVPDGAVEERVQAAMWRPVYRAYTAG